MQAKRAVMVRQSLCRQLHRVSPLRLRFRLCVDHGLGTATLADGWTSIGVGQEEMDTFAFQQGTGGRTVNTEQSTALSQRMQHNPLPEKGFMHHQQDEREKVRGWTTTQAGLVTAASFRT